MESLLRAVASCDALAPSPIHPPHDPPSSPCSRCNELAARVVTYESRLRTLQSELSARELEVRQLRGMLGALPPVGGCLSSARACALRLCEAPLSRFPHEYAVMDGKTSVQRAIAVVAATHKVVLHLRLIDFDSQPVQGNHVIPGGILFSLALILDSDGSVVSHEPVFEFTSADGGVQLAREDTVTFEFKLRYLSSRNGLQTMLRFRISPVDQDVAQRHPELVLCTPPFKSLARRNGSRHAKGGAPRGAANELKRQRSLEAPLPVQKQSTVDPSRSFSPSSEDDSLKAKPISSAGSSIDTLATTPSYV